MNNTRAIDLFFCFNLLEVISRMETRGNLDLAVCMYCIRVQNVFKIQPNIRFVQMKLNFIFLLANSVRELKKKIIFYFLSFVNSEDCSGISPGNKKKITVSDLLGRSEVSTYGLWMTYLDKLRALTEITSFVTKFINHTCTS